MIFLMIRPPGYSFPADTVAVDDFNNDGLLDIVISGPWDEQTEVLINIGITHGMFVDQKLNISECPRTRQ